MSATDIAARAQGAGRRAGVWRQILPYAMLSPAVVATLAIVFLPMIQTAW